MNGNDDSNYSSQDARQGATGANSLSADKNSESMAELFSDVKPLKKRDRADLRIHGATAAERSVRRQKEYARQNAIQANASGAGEQQILASSDDYLDWVKPNDLVSYKRPGVQEGVFRKLRLGKYSIEGRLDLHRKTVEQARREVIAFIREALAHESRTVMILHGKGERSTERQAVIKSYLVSWLKQLDSVLAFHSAQPQHGGTGAVYVLLRKSEQAKEKARERHAKRG